jgi:hypothetical protein
MPMQVLFGDMVKTAHQRPSEQLPRIFYPVCADSVLNVPDAVIDNPAAATHPAQFGVRSQLIGMQLDGGDIQPFLGSVDDRGLFHVRDVLCTHTTGSALGGSDDNGSSRLASDPLARPAILSPQQPASVELVHLDGTLKR